MIIGYCRLCNKPVERSLDNVAIRLRGRFEKTRYYHATCIDAERMNNRREYFKQKHNNERRNKNEETGNDKEGNRSREDRKL